MIIGRTQALRDSGIVEAAERVRICNETNVDAIFLVGVRSIDEVRRLRQETSLPLILNAMPSDATAEAIAALGARLYLQGHLPYYAALNTLYESYKHLVATGDQKPLEAKVLPKDVQAVALDEAGYAAWTKEYMGLS